MRYAKAYGRPIGSRYAWGAEGSNGCKPFVPEAGEYRQHDCIGTNYGYTDSRSALRAESRIHGDTELWIYGKKECDTGGKMARIGPGKKMRFGNEVPEGFVVVDFVDFLHDSANFKQAWFALAALDVL